MTLSVGAELDGFEWASPEDRRLAEHDALVYGNIFLRRDEDGLVHRIDPAAIEAVE